MPGEGVKGVAKKVFHIHCLAGDAAAEVGGSVDFVEAEVWVSFGFECVSVGVSEGCGLPGCGLGWLGGGESGFPSVGEGVDSGEEGLGFG